MVKLRWSWNGWRANSMLRRLEMKKLLKTLLNNGFFVLALLIAVTL